MTTVEELLTKVVQLTTGIPDAKPRPGQLLLANDIHAAMTEKGHMAGAAPTGVGKSFGGLIPAALVAAELGERTILSTDGLPLMDQYCHKDAAPVIAATTELTGKVISVAPLRGWSNYVCAAKLSATGRTIAGLDPEDGGIEPRDFAELATDPGLLTATQATGQTVTIDGKAMVKSDLASIAIWAAEQIATDQSGDKHAYEGVISDTTWKSISATSAECPGAKECAFGLVCRAEMAKERVKQADIVVTNHSLLGVQSAKGVPAVIGSARLGRSFRHIIVDEAHTLPSAVRDQGASAISGKRIAAINAQAQRLLGAEVTRVRATATADTRAGHKVAAEMAGKTATSTETTAAKIDEVGRWLADAIDVELRRGYKPGRGKDAVHKLSEGENPLPQTGEALSTWLQAVAKRVKTITPVGHMATQAQQRTLSKVETLAADVTAVTTGRSDTARWIELTPATRLSAAMIEVKATPVDVGGLLIGNLYTAPVLTDEDGEPTVPESDWSGVNERGKPTYRLSVSAISATLTEGFPREAGLRAKKASYASPFDVAYSNSLLYIPAATSKEDIAALKVPGPALKPRMDTASHERWSLPKTLKLVAANAGSALILAPTSAMGRRFAEALKSASGGRWHVHSQWDGPPTRQIVAAWKSDEGSILVGTKSLMTGVDAPGITCSLVVIVRPARAAGNPVDDARVSFLMEKLSIGKQSAMRMVYVSDASLLLEQSAGRLVRSMSDRGVVAVLDPRLVKAGPFSYELSDPRTREVYMNALSKFSVRTTDLERTCGFLADLKSGSSLAAA